MQKKYEKIPRKMMLESVLKFFRRKKLSFHKGFVKQISIMPKLLRIGYFVKYGDDGVSQKFNLSNST